MHAACMTRNRVSGGKYSVFLCEDGKERKSCEIEWFDGVEMHRLSPKSYGYRASVLTFLRSLCYN
jgi:hypothetical protein